MVQATAICPSRPSPRASPQRVRAKISRSFSVTVILFSMRKKTRTTAGIRGENQLGKLGCAVQHQGEYWQYSYCDNEFPQRYYLTASRWGTSLSSAPNYA